MLNQNKTKKDFFSQNLILRLLFILLEKNKLGKKPDCFLTRTKNWFDCYLTSISGPFFPSDEFS